MNKKIGLYAGSFDPPTNGHLWVIETAAKLFDELHIVAAINPAKKYMFNPPERWQMIHRMCKHIEAQLFTSTVENEFIVKYAKKCRAQYIVRGVRTIADYEFERQMAEINKEIEPSIETIILLPPPKISNVSSSAVKGLMGPVGWEDVVKNYVPECVLERLKEKV